MLGTGDKVRGTNRITQINVRWPPWHNVQWNKPHKKYILWFHFYEIWKGGRRPHWCLKSVMVSLTESASVDRSQNRDLRVLRTLLFTWVVPRVPVEKFIELCPSLYVCSFPVMAVVLAERITAMLSGWCSREGLFLAALPRQGFTIPGLSPVLPPWTHN